MESYLQENFGVKPKHSSTEALEKWRNLCEVVKNPKRRFRFTANLSKRYEAAALLKANQEKLRIAVLVSVAAIQFVLGVSPSDYTVPEEVKAASFQHPGNSRNSKLCIGKISGEKIFSVVSFFILIPTLVFQQLSNKNQPLYGTLAMSFSILTVILSITGFIYRGRKARAVWRWGRRMPWWYYPSPNGTKLFGSVTDIIGLVSAILQCILSVAGFCFYIKHEDNPIKISALPPVFACGMMCSQFLESSPEQHGETAV